jgi:hypothetical protein
MPNNGDVSSDRMPSADRVPVSPEEENYGEAAGAGARAAHSHPKTIAMRRPVA